MSSGSAVGDACGPQPHDAGKHTIDWAKFYARVRSKVLGGRIAPSAFETMEALIDAWYKGEGKDYRHLCYILATVVAECGRPMAPVRETTRGAGKEYGKPHPKTRQVYYGRGLVQLTWYENYLKMERLLGIPLTTQPDLALSLENSVKIILEGMYQGISKKGDFTGRSLEQYFNEKVEDPKNARRIVNGLDRADEIAGIYRQFKAAFLEAKMDPKLIMLGSQAAINMVKVLQEQLEQHRVPAPVAREIASTTVEKVSEDPEITEVQPPKPQVQSVTIWGAIVAGLTAAAAGATGVALSETETQAVVAAVGGLVSAIAAGVAWWGRVNATRVIAK